jgi:hypothetical protein
MAAGQLHAVDTESGLKPLDQLRRHRVDILALQMSAQPRPATLDDLHIGAKDLVHGVGGSRQGAARAAPLEQIDNAKTTTPKVNSPWAQHTAEVEPQGR